jgi:4-hydroxybenzoate polyprenyltransferase
VIDVRRPLRTAETGSARTYSGAVPPAASAVKALFRSTHPLPSAAVPAFATVLAAAAGNSAATCVLLALAVVTGQFSVGWSNDRLDVQRDRRVGHKGKPVAAGEVPLRIVDVALAGAVALTIVFSLLLGWRAGLLHLGAVAVAWLYNLKLKATWLSWLPYGLAFGALPAIATLALPAHPWPHGWVTATAALLGIAVNFLNAKQELADHPKSDVRGLPDRIGGHASLVVGDVLIAIAAALVTWAPPGPPRPIAWVVAVITMLVLLGGTVVLWRQARSRRPFNLLLVIVPLQLLVLVVTARPLY